MAPGTGSSKRFVVIIGTSNFEILESQTIFYRLSWKKVAALISYHYRLDFKLFCYFAMLWMYPVHRMKSVHPRQEFL